MENNVNLSAAAGHGPLVMQIRGVSASFNGIEVLRNFSLDIYKGETLSVVNTFSTNLRSFIDVIRGDIPISSGEIVFAEKRPHPIEFLLSGSHIFPEYNIMENIFITHKEFYLWSAKKKLRKTQELFDTLGIGIDPQRKCTSLTATEKKLILLAGLYVRKPSVAMLYDTMGFLDADGLRQFPNIINKLKESGIAVVYTTSKYEDALMISDRIAIFNDCRLSGVIGIDDARQHPRQLMYLLSGWDSVLQDKKENYDALAFESLHQARKILLSKNELHEALMSLIINFRKMMHYSSCAMYLFERDTYQVVDVVGIDIGHAHPGKDFLLASLRIGKTMIYSRTNEEASGFFEANGSAEWVAVCPINTENVKAVCCCYFENGQTWDDYLYTFFDVMKNEIIISVETSRWMGQSLLLKESHHRIKNNLQLIISMIMMQKLKAQKENATDLAEICDTIIKRIKSISSVHELMSNSAVGDNAVDIKRIIQCVIEFYLSFNVKFETDIESTTIPYNMATMITLVINELISNSIKHGIPPQGEKLTVRISFHHCADSIEVKVADNGQGLPKGFDVTQSEGLGCVIVSSIVKNLNGEILYSNENGATSFLKFPFHKLYF